MEPIQIAILAGTLAIGASSIYADFQRAQDKPQQVNCSKINPVPHGAVPDPLQAKCMETSHD